MRLVGQAVLEGGRSMDPARLASMTKRLACTALQSGAGEVMGLLASLDRLLRSAPIPMPCLSSDPDFLAAIREMIRSPFPCFGSVHVNCSVPMSAVEVYV